MLNRLGLVLHWIGFIFQFLLLFGYFPFTVLNGNVENIFEIILFDWGYYDIQEIIFVWVAIASWPINFILTGNKSFLPWRRDQ